MTTKKNQEDFDSTRLTNENENTVENEQTRVQDFNPAAPVSKSKLASSPWTSRLGFAVGGFAAGAAVGFGLSSNAATGSSSDSVSGLAADSTLTEGATPDDEQPEVNPEDSVSDRERTTIDDPNELRNSIIDESKATEIEVDTHTTAHNAASADASAGAASQIISDNNPVFHAGDTINAVSAQELNPNEIAEVEVTAPIAEEPVEIQVSTEELVDVTPEIPDEYDLMLVNENGVRYAHVTDDMSFSEAFAAAREQVGPGGAFEWHGNYYGTYYSEEWDQMSNTERSDFMASVTFPEEPLEDPVIYHEPVVEILSITATTDGEGHPVNIAHMTVDGHDIYLSDVDGDGIFDTLTADIDGDGSYTPGVDAILPIQDTGLTISDVYSAMVDVDTDPTDVDFFDPTEGMVDVDIDMSDDNDMPMHDDISGVDDMAMNNDFDNDSIPDF